MASTWRLESCYTHTGSLLTTSPLLGSQLSLLCRENRPTGCAESFLFCKLMPGVRESLASAVVGAEMVG